MDFDKLKEMKVGTIFIIISQIVLIILTIIAFTTGSVGAIVIASVLGITDAILLIFFLAANWGVSIEDINWDDPFY